MWTKIRQLFWKTDQEIEEESQRPLRKAKWELDVEEARFAKERREEQELYLHHQRESIIIQLHALERERSLYISSYFLWSGLKDKYGYPRENWTDKRYLETLQNDIDRLKADLEELNNVD